MEARLQYGRTPNIYKMKLQVNCAAAVLLLAILNLCAHIDGFTQQHLNDVLDDRIQMQKSQKNNNQLDRRRHQLHENAEDDTLDADQSPTNFLLIDYLNDGEVERRVSFNGIAAKETSIANSG